MHPLDGPRLKVKRANKHIYELEAALKDFGKTHPYEAVEQVEADTGDRVWHAKVNRQPPRRLSAIVGDAVHNLRSALDHVMAGFFPDAGRKSPAYPISNTAEQFEASLPKVKAAGQEAFKLIRASKAYKGGNDALWGLRELDDIDKRRLLITIGTAYRSVGIDMGAMLRASAGPEWADIPSALVFLKPDDRQYPLKSGDELFRIPANAPGAENHPDPEFTFDVALGEPEIFKGRPVLETLIELREQVEAVIASFAPLLGA